MKIEAMYRRLTRFAVAIALLVCARTAHLGAQEVVIVLPPRHGDSAGRGFDGFGATPISATAVLHSYMDATDSGATLGFALVIRGPAGWYNARTHFGELPADSLPPGTVGQSWQVGERRYRFVYDRMRQTLALFDTTVDLSHSRVVLVTVPSEASGLATVSSGAPVTLTMDRPTSFATLFLPRAPEVRTFAGLLPPAP
jgi:hypothetical protein